MVCSRVGVLSFFCFVWHALAPSPVLAAPLFIGLGELTGGAFLSGATGVSGDGTVVVGVSTSSAGSHAFRWSFSTGMVDLGVLPGGGFSQANAASEDGSVVVGMGNSANTGPNTANEEAFRWTGGGGMAGLGGVAQLPGPGGGISSRATDVSADGSVVVGFAFSGPGLEAFRWTSSEGMITLGEFAGGDFGSFANAVSSNGDVVVGHSVSSSSNPFGEAFRWTQHDGLVSLGDFTGGDTRSLATDVSGDGAVVVGFGTTNVGTEAFRWTASTGLSSIGDLPGGAVQSQAFATSGNGSVIVGSSETTQGVVAFLWDEQSGMRSLQEVLEEAGADLTGWSLATATGLSFDGRTIVGSGTNPNGNTEAWIAIIPEPTTALLVASGLAGIALRSRRVRSASSPDSTREATGHLG